ncbi:MAG TPA: glycosyltransferase family A protein [Candidatus Bathyarchaeia archaeon]|nr:glycosyltransferase family A protein [Candidatus Bathyarchaeia archaeon]
MKYRDTIFIYALKRKSIPEHRVATDLKALLKPRSPARNVTGDIGKVDVVVLTKNSEEQLERCLSAIYRNVPVNQLIIVDGYSTDKTLDIVEKFEKKHHNVLLLQDMGWRGQARQIGIENVKTEWFMFVDSDAELCNGWFKKARAFVAPNVGAVWGIEVWSVMTNSKFLRLFLQITMSIFQTRGGTHDLLVRREAVREIKIPGSLHSYEDAFIKDWINSKGYDVVATYNPYCIHHRPSVVWNIKSGVNIAQTEIRAGLFHKYPKLFLSYGFYIAYFTYQSLLRAALPFKTAK